MPMTVKDEGHVPVVLYQQRRAVVAVIAISATVDTAAGISLSQTVQSAETVNQLDDLNGHVQLGLLALNQVALVQEQEDYL